MPPRATRTAAPSAYRRIARWVTTLSAANLVLVLAYALMRRLLGGWGWLGIILSYPPQGPWIWPSAALGLAALVLRKRRALVLNALAAIIALFAVMGYQWSLGARAGPGQQTIRVMTYNIHGGTWGAFRVLNDVSAQQPDIAAFQESGKWGEHLDPIDTILAAFPGYVAQRSPEVAIVSRFPIVSSRVTSLPLRKGRDCLEVQVATPAGRLTVITAHLSSVNLVHSGGSRLEGLSRLAHLHDAQGRAVAALAGAAPPPTIVMGDFNAPPGSGAYRHLTRFGADAFAAAGRGFGCTYSARRPLVRIDYIFVGPGLRVRRAWTPRSIGSDHRPVVGDIIIPARR